jgi:hypothetical protein
MSLHPEVQALANLLREIEAMLSEHGEVQWAKEIASCITIVERSDAYGFHRFLKLFGGMGSLNDVVLCREGSVLKAENVRLRSLLTQASELGRRLVKDEN